MPLLLDDGCKNNFTCKLVSLLFVHVTPRNSTSSEASRRRMGEDGGGIFQDWILAQGRVVEIVRIVPRC